MPLPFQLPDPSPAERTPLVEALLGLIERLLEENRQQAESIQQLRDEIAVLKGEKPKPDCKASAMEKQTDPDAGTQSPGDGNSGSDPARRRPGSTKCPKTSHLTIHQELRVPPARPLPPGSRFKG